jgi:hypothetical protein
VNNNIVTGSISTNTQFLDSLFRGRVYLNIATAAVPTGIVRSQLVNRKGLSFDAIPTPGQMVPPITNVAQGVCVLRLSTNLDTLYFDGVADSLSSKLDYAHMHIGNFGAPYGAVQLDFTPFIVGRRVKGMIAGLSSGTTTYRLLTSNLSFVFHTTFKPNGEMRGQIIRYAREGYNINMGGNQVVPAVSSPAYGAGIVSTDRVDDNAHYLWNAGSLSSTATGAHFHKNVKTANGPQLYDMSSVMVTSGTDVSAEGFWKSSSTTPFLTVNSMQFSKDSIYLDIHNSAFPNGEIRGQVSRYSAGPAITVSVPANKKEISLSFMPNPVKQQLVIVAGGSDISSVTLMSMSGQKITEQFYNGSETSVNIDLSAYAPGIYFARISGTDYSISKKIVKE